MTRPALARLALVSLFAAMMPGVEAASRDAAVYPVSCRPPTNTPPPALLFDKEVETTLPGLPAEGSLRPAAGAASVLVRTTSGEFLVDVMNGKVLPSGGSGAVSAGAGGCSWEGRDPPAWFSRLQKGDRIAACVEGPRKIVATLSRDGAISGRDRKHGHLLWRRVATHRISREGASLGEYLFVAADASRALEAVRWGDGSIAGLFQLSSEDDYLASPPLPVQGRIAVLAVQSPRQETRLLVLRPRLATISQPTAGSQGSPAESGLPH